MEYMHSGAHVSNSVKRPAAILSIYLVIRGYPQSF
jgi:hypothetical protein